MREAGRRGLALRMRLVGASLLLVIVALAARAAWLSLLDPRAAERASLQIETVLSVAAARGSILARDRSPLAVMADRPSVYALPRSVEDRHATARALARALGLDAERVARRLASRSAFVFIARWVEPKRAAAVDALALEGIGVVREPRRVFPHGELAGPVLGFANIDGEGVRGIERQEDAWLRGRPLRIAVERDARGRLLAGGDLDPSRAAGGDVALTLDPSLQAAAERALESAVRRSGARGGIALSLDPLNGEILALAERPGFDPNAFRATPFPETRARALLDAFEPGSTLKPFLVAAALEEGVLAPDDSLDCENGVYRVPGKTLRDLHPHERLDPAGVLRVSSNIGAVKIGERLTPERHHAWLRRFGFGTTSGSHFPEESSGLLRSHERWRPVDRATLAFGQGISVTALQLAVATATLANEGMRVPPRLVHARRAPGQEWEPTPRSRASKVVSAPVARQVVEMLEGVVSPDGTARRAALRGLRVAGKTGTAQKLDAETGAYANDRYLAWFLGIVPADDPRLVVVVMLDEPQGGAHTGGAVAAPLFAELASAQLARLGVATAPEPLRLARAPSPSPEAIAAATAARAPAAPAPAPDVAAAAPAPVAVPAPAPAPRAPAPAAKSSAPRVETPRPEGPPAPSAVPVPVGSAVPVTIARIGDRLLLPDFRGLSPEQVRRIAGASPLRVEIDGEGHAVAQDPAPGTIVPAHTGVRVRFVPGGEG